MANHTPGPEPTGTRYRLAQEEPIRISRQWLRLCEHHWPRNAHAPAALLSSLVWWHHWNEDPDHHGPIHDGRTWVYMSDSDWYRQCGVSRGQASRIFAKFLELGWIETFTAPRPWSTSKRHVSWYRVVPQALDAALDDDEVARASARDSDEVPRASARDSGQVARASARDSGEVARASARVIGRGYVEREVTEESGYADATPSDQFEAFWRAYPTRNGTKGSKSAARSAWDRLPSTEQIRAAANLPRFAAHVSRTDTYPPDASRWLQRTRRNGTNYVEWDQAAEPAPIPRRGRPNVEDAIAGFLAQNERPEQLALEAGS